MFDFYKGEIISWETEFYSGSERYEYGKHTQLIYYEIMVKTDKGEIEGIGPRKVGRRECAVNSEPLTAAENFRRADSLRPSADEMKIG